MRYCQENARQRNRDEGSCYSNQDGCSNTSNEGVFNLPRLSSSFDIPDHLASPSMQNCQSELISPLAASSPTIGNSSTSISVSEPSRSEERRGGQECVSRDNTRWAASHTKKK